MNNYCTLFASNYLIKGFAMYRSLIIHDTNAFLYIFAMDEECAMMLENLKLERVMIIRYEYFQTEALNQIRLKRSLGEFCWTCTPFVIAFVLKNFKVDNVTYLDADIYFFSNPYILLEEFYNNKADVSVLEHRYAPTYSNFGKHGMDCREISGKYCVEFMTFRANDNSLAILKWWGERCLEWCFSYVDIGRFGDQVYVEEFEKNFTGIYSLKNIGAGVAYWNISQYECDADLKINNEKIVFYHFSGLHRYGNGKYTYGTYIARYIFHLIYEPYIKELEDCVQKVKKIDLKFSFLREHDMDKISNYLWCRINRNEKCVEGLFKKTIRSSKLYIWGLGTRGKKLYQWLDSRNIKIDGFIERDNFKISTKYWMIPIFSPEDIDYNDSLVIITPRHYYYDIIKFLDGCKKKNVCFDYKTLDAWKDEVIKYYLEV